MESNEKGYKSLFTELKNYENNGVPILMDGSKASPMQIVEAHMLREEGSYMRDYVMDPEGYLQSLTFYQMNK